MCSIRLFHFIHLISISRGSISSILVLATIFKLSPAETARLSLKIAGAKLGHLSPLLLLLLLSITTSIYQFSVS